MEEGLNCKKKILFPKIVQYDIDKKYYVSNVQASTTKVKTEYILQKYTFEYIFKEENRSTSKKINL